MMRSGPLFIHGAIYVCRICGETISPGGAVLSLPWAPFPKWEPMANFESMMCHLECWRDWPLRDRFVVMFNRYASDAILHIPRSSREQEFFVFRIEFEFGPEPIDDCQGVLVNRFTEP